MKLDCPSGGAGLGSKDSSGAAAISLRNVCSACGPRLAPYMDALMQLFQRVQTCGALTEDNGMLLDEEDVEQASDQ